MKNLAKIVLIFVSVLIVVQFMIKVKAVEIEVEADTIEISDTIEQEILRLINIERVNNGLEELYINEELVTLANMKAEDLVENNYFSHYSQKYKTAFDMMKNKNITYKMAGENLSRKYYTAKSSGSLDELTNT